MWQSLQFPRTPLRFRGDEKEIRSMDAGEERSGFRLSRDERSEWFCAVEVI